MFANETNIAIFLVAAMLQINFMEAETPVWSSDQYYFILATTFFLEWKVKYLPSKP